MNTFFSFLIKSLSYFAYTGTYLKLIFYDTLVVQATKKAPRAVESAFIFNQLLNF